MVGVPAKYTCIYLSINVHVALLSVEKMRLILRIRYSIDEKIGLKSLMGEWCRCNLKGK